VNGESDFWGMTYRMRKLRQWNEFKSIHRWIVIDPPGEGRSRGRVRLLPAHWALES